MTIDKQTNASVDWVERAINENYIKYYNCSEFTTIKEINGNGSAGKIYQANWKGADSPLVIKSSYKLTIKEIVNEVITLFILFYFFVITLFYMNK